MQDAIIGFEDHTIRCIIGCCAHERIEERDILVDLAVHGNVSVCAKSDRIEDAINYVRLAQVCTEVAQRGKFYLLEALSSAILDRILQEFPVTKVTIKVKKPSALPSAKWTSVQMERSR